MNFQLKLNNEKLQSLNGQLAYVNEALKQSDIKEWELREFKETKNVILNDILNTESLIIKIKEMM